MGWIVGFEPTVSSATNWRFNQLSYTHHMARLKGLEPLTHCLEGSCSIHLSYKRICYIPTQIMHNTTPSNNIKIISPAKSFVKLFFAILFTNFTAKKRQARFDTRRFVERVMGVEPTRPAWKAGILPLNYTRRTLFILPLKKLFVNTFFYFFVFL